MSKGQLLYCQAVLIVTMVLCRMLSASNRVSKGNVQKWSHENNSSFVFNLELFISWRSKFKGKQRHKQRTNKNLFKDLFTMALEYNFDKPKLK